MGIVLFATAFCYAWRYGLHGAFGSVHSIIWVGAALVSTWVVAAASLRHYAHFAYDRSLLDEAAMIATQTSAAITVLALLDLLAPAGTPLPRVPHMLILLWCPAMLLRVAIFRQFAGREEPVANVLIVGIGPIGRLTGQDLKQRGRQVIAGYLRLNEETEKDAGLLKRSNAAAGEVEILGVAADIEKVLRKHPVDEVYVAGNVRKHGDEMQEGHPRLREVRRALRAARVRLPAGARPGHRRPGHLRRLPALPDGAPAAVRALDEAALRHRLLGHRAVAAPASAAGGHRADQAHLPRADLLPADARRPAWP